MRKNRIHVTFVARNHLIAIQNPEEREVFISVLFVIHNFISHVNHKTTSKLFKENNFPVPFAINNSELERLFWCDV